MTTAAEWNEMRRQLNQHPENMQRAKDRRTLEDWLIATGRAKPGDRITICNTALPPPSEETPE